MKTKIASVALWLVASFLPTQAIAQDVPENPSAPKMPCKVSVERFTEWEPSDKHQGLGTYSIVTWDLPEGVKECHAQYFFRSLDFRQVDAYNIICLYFGLGRVACGTDIRSPANAYFYGAGDGSEIKDGIRDEPPTIWTITRPLPQVNPHFLFFPIVITP